MTRTFHRIVGQRAPRSGRFGSGPWGAWRMALAAVLAAFVVCSPLSMDRNVRHARSSSTHRLDTEAASLPWHADDDASAYRAGQGRALVVDGAHLTATASSSRDDDHGDDTSRLADVSSATVPALAVRTGTTIAPPVSPVRSSALLLRAGRAPPLA